MPTSPGLNPAMACKRKRGLKVGSDIDNLAVWTQKEPDQNNIYIHTVTTCDLRKRQIAGYQRMCPLARSKGASRT